MTHGLRSKRESIKSLKSRDDIPSLDDVIKSLLQDYNAQSSDTAKFIRSNEFNNRIGQKLQVQLQGSCRNRCDHCNKTSHAKERCWPLQPELKPKKDPEPDAGNTKKRSIFKHHAEFFPDHISSFVQSHNP